jgi:hypothetical protein
VRMAGHSTAEPSISIVPTRHRRASRR